MKHTVNLNSAPAVCLQSLLNGNPSKDLYMGKVLYTPKLQNHTDYGTHTNHVFEAQIITLKVQKVIMIGFSLKLYMTYMPTSG